MSMANVCSISEAKKKIIQIATLKPNIERKKNKLKLHV